MKRILSTLLVAALVILTAAPVSAQEKTLMDFLLKKHGEIELVFEEDASIDDGFRLVVGDEVYEAFAKADFEMSSISRRDAKWHIDLPLCNRLQLEDMGVPSHQITVAPDCTFKQPETWFSARRLGIQSGRIFTGIMLK